MKNRKMLYWSQTNNAWLKVFANTVEGETEYDTKVVLLTEDSNGEIVAANVLGILEFNSRVKKGTILEGWGESEE